MAKQPAKTTPVEEAQLPATIQDSSFEIVRMDESRVKRVVEMNLGDAELTHFSLPRIRVPDGQSDFWTIPDPSGDSVPEAEIVGVVVNFKSVRAFWPDQDITGKPPACSSSDGKTGIGCRSAGLGSDYEHDSSDQPHTCRTCKHAKFESDPKYGRGQWCKAMQVLLFVRETGILPYCLFLPPTSIKSMRDYLVGLTGIGHAYNGVVTRIGLAKAQNPEGNQYNTARPSMDRELSQEERKKIDGYSKAIAEVFTKVSVEFADDYISPKKGGDVPPDAVV